jgi:hypothetical protein
MMLNSGGAWMVQGSPARLMRDYNQLLSSYNSGAKFWGQHRARSPHALWKEVPAVSALPLAGYPE